MPRITRHNHDMPDVPRSYIQAAALAKTSKRKLGHNTYLVELPREGPDAYGVRLHATDVAVFEPDGTLILNSGGWRTRTTQRRINAALSYGGFRVRSFRGEWWLHKWGERVAPFEDGMRLPATRPE